MPKLTKTEKKILRELLVSGRSYESGLKGRRSWGNRVTKMVNRLEEKGFVTVVRDSCNHGRHGRVDIHTTHYTELTEEGRALAGTL